MIKCPRCGETIGDNLQKCPLCEADFTKEELLAMRDMKREDIRMEYYAEKERLNNYYKNIKLQVTFIIATIILLFVLGILYVLMPNKLIAILFFSCIVLLIVGSLYFAYVKKTAFCPHCGFPTTSRHNIYNNRCIHCGKPY